MPALPEPVEEDVIYISDSDDEIQKEHEVIADMNSRNYCEFIGEREQGYSQFPTEIDRLGRLLTK